MTELLMSSPSPSRRSVWCATRPVDQGRPAAGARSSRTCGSPRTFPPTDLHPARRWLRWQQPVVPAPPLSTPRTAEPTARAPTAAAAWSRDDGLLNSRPCPTPRTRPWEAPCRRYSAGGSPDGAFRPAARRGPQPRNRLPTAGERPWAAQRRRQRDFGGDQADSSSRPLRRRAARIARPARVRIRRRKPWTLARRRLFGWKVRLLTRSPKFELQDYGFRRLAGTARAGPAAG